MGESSVDHEVDGGSDNMDEDDSDYIVDEDNRMDDHEVDMTDYRYRWACVANPGVPTHHQRNLP
ncbi:hypothetical protein R6Q59_034034 [Mikania micrantha]